MTDTNLTLPGPPFPDAHPAMPIPAGTARIGELQIALQLQTRCCISEAQARAATREVMTIIETHLLAGCSVGLPRIGTLTIKEVPQGRASRKQVKFLPSGEINRLLNENLDE